MPNNKAISILKCQVDHNMATNHKICMATSYLLKLHMATSLIPITCTKTSYPLKEYTATSHIHLQLMEISLLHSIPITMPNLIQITSQ